MNLGIILNSKKIEISAEEKAGFDAMKNDLPDLFAPLAMHSIIVGSAGLVSTILGCVAGRKMSRCGIIIFRILTLAVALGYAWVALLSGKAKESLDQADMLFGPLCASAFKDILPVLCGSVVVYLEDGATYSGAIALLCWVGVGLNTVGLLGSCMMKAGGQPADAAVAAPVKSEEAKDGESADKDKKEGDGDGDKKEEEKKDEAKIEEAKKEEAKKEEAKKVEAKKEETKKEEAKKEEAKKTETKKEDVKESDKKDDTNADKPDDGENSDILPDYTTVPQTRMERFGLACGACFAPCLKSIMK
jgi:flagellar biosynthesis GTPase FlhF